VQDSRSPGAGLGTPGLYGYYFKVFNLFDFEKVYLHCVKHMATASDNWKCMYDSPGREGCVKV